MSLWMLRFYGFASLADSMSVGIWVTDARGRTAYMNAKMLGMIGAASAPGDARGVIDASGLASFASVIDVQRAGASSSSAVLRLAADGLPSVHMSSSRMPGSAYRGSVHVVTDASDVDRSARVFEDMAATAAHDLRGPLASVKAESFAAMSVAGLPPEVAVRLSAIDAAVDRLSGLVASVLDASLVRSGGARLVRSEVDLGRLAHEAAGQLSSDASAASASVSVSCEGDVVGHWDEGRVWQVVVNLLSNAIKYGRGRVSVRVSRDGGDALLVVSDGGPGIDPTDRRRIFGKFQRLSAASPQPGSGLGLWIVRSVVDAHGGSVSVRNAVEGGAEFEVRLPVRR